jgi:DNA-binding transcriptional ArsR family regulator
VVDEFSQEKLRKLSYTKIKILQLLRKRRRTLSEISKELKLSKPAVHTHLSSLNKAELVIKINSNYKWIYYELTEKAEQLLKEYAEIHLQFTS